MKVAENAIFPSGNALSMLQDASSIGSEKMLIGSEAQNNGCRCELVGWFGHFQILGNPSPQQGSASLSV